MEELRIESVNIDADKINIHFKTTKGLEKYFNEDKYFWVTYSSPMTDLPKSIAIIPFICNILPIIWITDTHLILSELDKNFFNSIDNFKKGYINMYPQIEFKGQISVDELVINKENSTKSALLFSGGVDAFSSLVSLASQKPELATIWGADIATNNIEAWNKVETHIIKVSEEFNLKYRVIKSNFRTFLKEEALTLLVARSGDNYWHGFQHGIALVGLTAPYAYKEGIKNIYISSSFTEEIKQEALATTNKKITCASDPSIDNYIQFGSTNTIHYQYDMDRQMKIKNIHSFADLNKKSIALRVCWLSDNGDNCCLCEKCYRTITGLWAEGANPVNYGFNIKPNFSAHLIKSLKTKDLRPINWIKIQNRFRENKNNIHELEFMKWITNANFEKINNSPIKKIKKLPKRVSCKLTSILRKNK